MTLPISVLSTIVLALVPCGLGLQNLRNAKTLEPSVPEFLSRADSTLRFISRQLVANAPSEVEIDLQAQAEGDRHSSCSLAADEDFRLESLNQSEDLRFCAQRGLKHIMKFAEPFPLEDKRTFMPTFSSHSLTKRAKGVTHAVIWMHGGRMNANKYACDALNLTEATGAENQTLTLVPFFSTEKMTKKQWTGDPHAKNQVSVCWNSSQAWVSGGESSDEATTAFGVLDRMVIALQTKLRRNFPHLKRIVITGFSGGCQLLQRWSFFSNVLRPDYSNIPVTLILGSCGSYMYLDNTRPAESCSPLMHSGTDHTCDQFRKPEHDDCPQYDTFKYGLSLHHKQYTGYLRSFAEYSTLIGKRQDDYFHKDIRFLFGDVDGCSCNIEGYYNPPDMCFPALGKQCMPNHHGGSNGYDEYSCCDTYPGGTHNNVAHTCEALLQGSNRLQRGLNYLGHLRHFYYKRHNSTYHPMFGIFAGAHNSTAAYTTDKFRQWAFGDIKGVTISKGAKAGSSKARDPHEDPFAYDWSSESSDDAYDYDDWEDEEDSDDSQDAEQDLPQETWPPADAATGAANQAQPQTQPQAVGGNPAQAPQAPLPQLPVTTPPASPLWVPTRQNWNCNGANSPESVAETMSNTDGQCQAFCTNYAFSGFWPREHLCRCYSNCAAVGGETSTDFPNTVYQKGLR